MNIKVLGARVGPKSTRIALVKRDGCEYELLTSGVESRLKYPADLPAVADRALWLYREMQRLQNEHPDTAKVCIKTNDFGLTDTKSKRESAYLEGVILLHCGLSNVEVMVHTYSSLPTRSADVKMDAERLVGRTDKYWDNPMADAVVAAWKAART